MTLSAEKSSLWKSSLLHSATNRVLSPTEPLKRYLPGPDHRRQIARVGDQDVVVAAEHHRHAVKGEGVDVIERQRRDQHFAAVIEVRAHQRLALQHVGNDVAVRQHGALGHAGGAAGVLQHGHVFALGDASRTALPRPSARASLSFTAFGRL